MGESWRKYNDDGSLTAESKAFQKKYLSGKGKGNNFGPGPGPATKGLASKSSDTGGGRTSSSSTIDYSAVDEARTARSKAEAAKGAAASAAYAGDIPKAMAAGHTIRALQKQANEASRQGPRVRSSQRSHTRPNQESKVTFK